VHICLITVWGKLNWGIHEFLGFSILLFSNIAATSGLIMVGADIVRYDTFTSFFLIFAAGSTYLFTILFILAFIFKPKFSCACCWPRFASFTVHHSNIGFLYLVGPLGMLVQFIVYSIRVGIQGAEHGGCSAVPLEGDYESWKVSLYICIIIALIMSISFYKSYFMITKPTIYPLKKTMPKPLGDKCCTYELNERAVKDIYTGENNFRKNRDESRKFRQERREKIFGKSYNVLWNKPQYEEYRPLAYRKYDNVFQENRDRRRVDRKNLRLKIEEGEYPVRKSIDPFTTHYYY